MPVAMKWAQFRFMPVLIDIKHNNMKSFISSIVLLALLPMCLSAQKTFYGTITYSYDVEGDNVEQVRSMLPSGMSITYGKDAIATNIDGGMMGMSMGKIIVKDGQAFMIQDESKTIFEMSKIEMEAIQKQQAQMKPEITKLDGTREIMGYTCEKFSMTNPQLPEPQILWITKDLKAPEVQGMAMTQSPLGNVDIEGVALEVVTTIPQVGAKMIMTVTEMKEGEVPASTFEKPKDYETKPFSDFAGGR